LAFLSLASIAPSIANADLVVGASATSWTVGAGGIGTFDIIVTNTGLSDVSVEAWNTSMISQDPFLQFTDADGNTSDSYIFGSVQFAPLAPAGTLPGTTLSVSDINASDVTLTPGSTFGLAHVTFTVSASATPGLFIPILFGSDTSFANSGGSVSFTDPVGIGPSVTVGPQVVPEPSSMVLAGLVTGCGAWLANRRRVLLKTTSKVMSKNL